MKYDEIFQAIKDYWSPNGYHLDEYLVKSDEKKPFALIIPGGGYQMVCSFAEGLPIAKKLNKKGYNAFILRYSVKKKAKFPQPLLDAVRAIKYIIANADRLNVDTNNYSVWGFSAGGHLAGLYSAYYKEYDLPKPSATILSYPVVTMGELTHQGSKNNLIGQNASQYQINKTSLEQLVTADFPNTYIWCSKKDDTVNPQNSLLLVKALRDKNITFKFHQFNSGKHGCGLGTGTECEPWFDESVEFWRECYEKE